MFKVYTLFTFLCIVVLLGSIGFVVGQAEGLSSGFSDSFEGSAVDSSVWQVHEQNLPRTQFPAWGGSIRVADGYLYMSSDGSTFPFIQTLRNPFPATGDFAVQFSLTYTEIGDWGAGLMIGNGTPTLESSSYGPFGPNYAWHNRIFTLWAADKGTPEQSSVYIELFNSFVYEMVYPGFRPSSPTHVYKLAYAEGFYHVYVDGAEVASVESDVRPTTIVIGHPPIYELPHSPQSTVSAENWGWSSFTVDYIAMQQKAKISLSLDTQTLQLGNRINISGTLSGGSDEPLAGEMVDIFFSVPGVSSWYPLAAATTDLVGCYSVIWVPSANGNFRLKISWGGNDNYVGASTEKNVSVLYDDQTENTFVAESNSTLSSLSFNATAREISFTVKGDSGTTGYVRFAIPISMLPTLDGFKVYMDGAEVKFNSVTEEDIQVLYFEYHHSSHEFTLRMPVLTTPEFQSWLLLPLLTLVSLGAFAARKKKLL